MITFAILTRMTAAFADNLKASHVLKINPLLMFLGLWLGGLFWGVAGVMLATPVLVALKVIAEHIDGGHAILEFLGPETARVATRKSAGKFVVARPINER